MSETRKKVDLQIFATVLTVTLLVGVSLYVVGYFALTKAPPIPDGTSSTIRLSKVRIYDSQMLARVYLPAGRVETLLTGQQVEIVAKADWK